MTSPARRAVLLGASNLTRGTATVYDEVRRHWGGPLDLLVASGHGRSYGQRSRVIVRDLPGIVECGLWQALDERPAAPTAALITDVGNDILYGVPVHRIDDWIEICIRRLQDHNAAILLTGLPTCNLGHLSPGRFRFFLKLFHPKCSLSLDMVRAQAEELNECLREISARHLISFVEACEEWYGLDPIHIRRRLWRNAWSSILKCWQPDGTPLPPHHQPLRNWIHLRTRAPEHRWLCGREQWHPQPAARLADGTTVSLY